MKALDDCDVLKENIILHLDKLVAQPQCVKSIRLDFKDSDNTATKAGPFVHPEKEVHFRTLTNKCITHDVEILVVCSCTGSRIHRSKFEVNPMTCYDMRRELNFTINEKSSKVLINNEFFRDTNKYMKMCMRSVSLFNRNGTEIDNAWKKEYEVAVNRCKNETFTIIYHFASGDNSQGEKLEKVVKVPWDPENCLETREETQMILASAIAASSVFVIILLTISIVCCKRRKETVKTDYNDIYGTYGRGWDDEGDYGDGDQMEVTDHNPVYGT